MLDEPRRKKRGLGIAHALILITAFGVHRKSFSSDSHPAAYNRLLVAMDAHFAGEAHDVVVAYIVAALQLHLSNTDIKTPDEVYESFQECIEKYADTLAELDEPGARAT